MELSINQALPRKLVRDGVHGQIPANPYPCLKRRRLTKKYAQALWTRKPGSKSYQTVTREFWGSVWVLEADGTALPIEDGWETQYLNLGDQIAFGSMGLECHTHRIKGTAIGISFSTIVDIDSAGTIITENGKRFSYTKGEVDAGGNPVSVGCDLHIPAHVIHRVEKGDRVFRHFKNVGPLGQDVTFWYLDDQPAAIEDDEVVPHTHLITRTLLSES
jgi:hypothetical protein